LFVPKLSQIFPAVEAAIVSVVEDEPDRVLTHGFHTPNSDGLLSEYQGFLSRPMAFDFRGGGVDS
jgi:hypothetical protein